MTTLLRNSEGPQYDGRTVRVEGKRLLNFGSSSHLGLELRPELAQGARDAMFAYGTAFPFQRVNFESPLQAELEAELGHITNAASVLVTASAEAAHLCALSALAQSGDTVILDRHARKRLKGAVGVLRDVPFEHARVQRLEQIDARLHELSQKYERIWLVFDGIDPTYGDFAPFDALAGLLAKYPKLWLYVDDGDSTSWYGENGRGAAQSHFAGHPRVVVTLGLGASFAAAGAALLFGDPALLETVRSRGECLLQPLAAPMLGAAVASARIHASPELAELQASLHRRIDFMFELAAIGAIPLASAHKTPRFFLFTKTPERAGEIAQSLASQGFYVSPIRVTVGGPRVAGVRFTVSLHNEFDDIGRFADALAAEAKTLHGVRRPVPLAAE